MHRRQFNRQLVIRIARRLISDTFI